MLCDTLHDKLHSQTQGEQVITPQEMENYEEEAAHERRESTHERHREAALKRNPDCRDPDHPGCEFCEDKESD